MAMYTISLADIIIKARTEVAEIGEEQGGRGNEERERDNEEGERRGDEHEGNRDMERGEEGQQQVAAGEPPPAAETSSSFSNTRGISTTSRGGAGSIITNSGGCRDRLTLLVFVVHILGALAALGFLGFKAIWGAIRGGGKQKRVVEFWVPPVEVAILVGAFMAVASAKATRWWPKQAIHTALWGSFTMTMAASIVMLSFSTPSTVGIGTPLLIFSICDGLYCCWVTRRLDYAVRVLSKALEPTAKFPDLAEPLYWLVGVAAVWTSAWSLALSGASSMEGLPVPALLVFMLVLSMAWTLEVLRNIGNLTVCRVMGLYYTRGIQSIPRFCFERALTNTLGSACLGSALVPMVEALRILARTLNLVEGEDEFLFSCAHCCFRVMEDAFHCANGWGFVMVAVYGKGFVSASRSTLDVIRRRKMESLMDSDITSSVCFLSGILSGAICAIIAGSFAKAYHMEFTATVTLASFFIGYLMTRISMVLPHACVNTYYVCYAEKPDNKLFDETIPNQLKEMSGGAHSTITVG
ncbi:hypothetical protein AMTR_s00107p00022990 [Amborella trichopoda]|uniref:Choline transporter-like protein n=1 Tax=Amborella trichopoda TaxID=13333 RepID=W1NY45_AMBTC|nr:hypothetical protein AMTR_s00107p00022990 [Amborella trichopoda]